MTSRPESRARGRAKHQLRSHNSWCGKKACKNAENALFALASPAPSQLLECLQSRHSRSWHHSSPSARAESQSETKNSISNAQEKYTRWGAVFPGNFTPMLMLRADCSLFALFTTRFALAASHGERGESTPFSETSRAERHKPGSVLTQPLRSLPTGRSYLLPRARKGPLVWR